MENDLGERGRDRANNNTIGKMVGQNRVFIERGEGNDSAIKRQARRKMLQQTCLRALPSKRKPKATDNLAIALGARRLALDHVHHDRLQVRPFGYDHLQGHLRLRAFPLAIAEEAFEDF